jgi:hypothetical protein
VQEVLNENDVRAGKMQKVAKIYYRMLKTSQKSNIKPLRNDIAFFVLDRL